MALWSRILANRESSLSTNCFCSPTAYRSCRLIETVKLFYVFSTDSSGLQHRGQLAQHALSRLSVVSARETRAALDVPGCKVNKLATCSSISNTGSSWRNSSICCFSASRSPTSKRSEGRPPPAVALSAKRGHFLGGGHPTVFTFYPYFNVLA